MLAKIKAGTVVGIHAFPVEVEVDTNDTGMIPVMIVVGLPDAAVRESRDRVKTAVMNSAFHLPKRITINLAPGDLKKEGAVFDFPIALAIIAASEQLLSNRLDDFMAVGELGLDGDLRPIRGVLPLALMAREHGYRGLLVPAGNAEEASVVEGLEVYGIETLQDGVRFLAGDLVIPPSAKQPFAEATDAGHHFDIDFSDVKGQENVKRALEVAAAGGHNLLMIGPPGSGKSMLAKRVPTILPPLTLEESLETTKIHSVSGLLETKQSLVTERPFRSPHHTISDIGLIGGSSQLTPGEVSLAHNGVLFMDELPEFKRSALEVLRQPLEDGQVTISRATGTLTFPSRVMLIAAMNPTPTGYAGDVERGLISPALVQKYLSKISGPLLDRMDIHLEVSALKHDELLDSSPGDPSSRIRERVVQARKRQIQRFSELSKINQRIWCNAQMGSREIRDFVPLDEECQQLVRHAMENLNLSARAYDRILKVARTIADLADKDHVDTDDLGEAIQYRNLDRQFWS